MFRKYTSDPKFMLKFARLGEQVISYVTNDILHHTDIGKDKECQGPRFTHKRNYYHIENDMKNLLEYQFLAHNLTSPDTSGYFQHMTKKQFDERFGKLCEFYGVK